MEAKLLLTTAMEDGSRKIKHIVSCNTFDDWDEARKLLASIVFPLPHAEHHCLLLDSDVPVQKRLKRVRMNEGLEFRPIQNCPLTRPVGPLRGRESAPNVLNSLEDSFLALGNAMFPFIFESSSCRRSNGCIEVWKEVE